MDRRQFLIHTSLLAAGSMLPLRSLNAQANTEFTPLRRNVGYFTGQGGTIGWLASEEALAVVDSQFPETAQHCLEGLQKKTAHPLDLLINTHHHGDHTSGNAIFKPVAQMMVAHENVPGLMQQAAEGSDDDKPAFPTTTYKDEWEVDMNNETIRIRYYGPAHTSGDSVVFFEEANVVHMGDLVFNRMNPYTDRPAGASIHNWIKVLKTVEDEYPADAIYVFGHGNPEFGVTGSKKDVAVMRSYLSAMVEYVEQKVKQGHSREEIVKRQAMEGFEEFLYADWWKLSQNLDVVYQEIKER